MGERIQNAFQEMLEKLADGQPIEAVMQAYPQYAVELQGLLETAMVASGTMAETPEDKAASERSRTRMLQYAARQRPARTFRSAFWTLGRSTVTALLAAAMILLSGSGIWVVSAQSLPGDPLYGLKLRAEEINRAMVTNESSRYELDLVYRQKRVDEIKRLLDQDRIEAVTFEGILLEQAAGVWNVEKILILVHADTLLIGAFSIGDQVEVQGMTTESHTVLAKLIELRRYDLTGIVESTGDKDWVIAGRSIDISNAIIEPGITLGSIVVAIIEVNRDGLHSAILITAFDPPTMDESEPPVSKASPPTPITTEILDERKFEGKLESMSRSAIIVDGQTIYLNDFTEINGILAPGAQVKVEAAWTSDGFWVAVEIKVLEGKDQAGDESPEDEEDLDDEDKEGDEDDDPDDD